MSIGRRAINDTSRSKPAIKIARWIREMGYMVEEEYPVGRYSIDIYLPHLHTAVEVDGPYHSKAKDKKRDETLLTRHAMPTVRIPTRTNRETVRRIIEEAHEEYYPTANERLLEEEMNFAADYGY